MSGRELSRRQFVGTAAAGAVSVGGCALLTSNSEPRESEPTGAVDDMLVIGAAPLLSADRDADDFRAAVAAIRSAAVDIAFATVANQPSDSGTMLRNLLRLHRYAGEEADAVRVISGPDGLARLQREGGLGILPRLGGMQMIPAGTPEEMLAAIKGLRALGVAVVQPVYNWKNRIGDGCFERTDQPLTATGRLAVRALNDSGVVIDLSAMGLRSSLECLELSEYPIVFSHANAARVHAHRANLTDEQIDGCARSGGVIGISAFPALISGSTAPTLEEMLRHVDYIVERVGADHVGLGLDFDDRARRRFPSDPVPDPPYRYPTGLTRIEDAPGLRPALLSRGYTPNEVRQMLGGNFLRMLRRVWEGGRKVMP